MKIHIRKGNFTQPYYVSFVANNGKTIAHTENYASKANAKNAAELIKAEAGSATIVDDA